MTRAAWSNEARAQAALFVRAARTSFAYKPAIVVGFLTVALGYLIPMLVWRHVYVRHGASLALPASELFPYLLLAAALNFCAFMNVESRISQRIRLGLIATDLLRPVDFQLMQLVQSLADVVLNLTLVLPFLVLAYVLWGSAALPHDGVALLAFLASSGLALLIQFGIAYIFVQITFVTFSNYGVFVARNALQQTFSGVSAPLVLFPPALRSTAEQLPFCHTVHTPVSIYLGWTPRAEIASALLVQLGWAVALMLCGRALLGFFLRHMEIQGG
jgi:ABC-2 type transport system permease protein